MRVGLISKLRLSGQRASAYLLRAMRGGMLPLLLPLLLPLICLSPVQAGDAAVDSRPAMIPQILSEQDATLYQRIFALQHDGKMQAAEKLLQQVDDRRLQGHVLYQRYMHPTAYRSRYRELQAWMSDYSDHPGAYRIYKLAMRRKPDSWQAPVTPQKWRNRAARDENIAQYHSPTQRSAGKQREIRRIRRHIQRLIGRGQPTNALKYLQRKEIDRQLDAVETDLARGEIAKGYFLAGLDAKALQQAELAANRSGNFVPQAHWFAGLAAWRQGDAERAATHFSALADNHLPYASSWDRAAAAYWAARAWLTIGQPQKISHYLTIAAQHPRTLHGILARRQLGQPLAFDWTSSALTQGALHYLQQFPAVDRMIALVQAGQPHRADLEMQQLLGQIDPSDDIRLLALANMLRLPASQLRIGNIAKQQGSYHPAALYPIPTVEPADGFRADPALLYALMRQESKFMSHAKSHRGAHGLMQIMPATASYILKDGSLRRADRYRLLDPVFNVTLGQRYVEYLMAQPGKHSDLFTLAAAYNAGPGNLRRWLKTKQYYDDPLLFIETIPSLETRQFIRRVAANYWIYQDRLGHAQPTLDALAAGGWPTFPDAGDPRRQAQYDSLPGTRPPRDS